MKSWPLWTIFALCLTTALAAMAWISATALRLERMQVEASRQSQLEENVRLALWRMDSWLAPIIAQETARPYFAYTAFMPAERAYTRMYSELQYGEVLVPSPLLSFQSPLIHLHFQFNPDGSLISPQVPTGNMRDLAGNHTTREHLIASAARLNEARAILRRPDLLAALPADGMASTWSGPMFQTLPLLEQLGQVPANAGATSPDRADGAQSQLEQKRDKQLDELSVQGKKSAQEWQARAQNTMQQQVANYDMARNRYNYSLAGQQAPAQPATQPVASPSASAASSHVREGIMHPLWIGDALILARRVSINEQDYIQGCWLNWPGIRASMLDSIQDLLPAAQLLPTLDMPQERQPRRLATIPVQLAPGAIAYIDSQTLSPIRITLIAAWVCAVVGSIAIAALLWGAMSLSQRRGAFVSAVTHELRTPLTTLSMYAEMLEEGMVPNEQKRRTYLGTLRREADRLGHLVENVLAYSRIERANIQGRIQTIPLAQLINGIKDRLVSRAEQAGMQLCIDLPDDAAGLPVRADASAVEQILFNLVDNAAKYAAPATDRRVHLEVSRNHSHAFMCLRDHGPGIPPADARKLFRPFSKSAKDAANSAPGVGLGLALSRRLARQMRGDLRLEQPCKGGACFSLSLRIA